MWRMCTLSCQTKQDTDHVIGAPTRTKSKTQRSYARICWPMFGNSTRGSRRTHPSIATAAMDSAGSVTIITVVATAVVTGLRASNRLLHRLAHRRKELQERQMPPTIVRNMLSTMELIHTQHMVVTRTTSPTTSITSKLHNNSSSSSNSLRALLLQLPQHLRPLRPRHRDQDLPHRPLPVAATARYVLFPP